MKKIILFLFTLTLVVSCSHKDFVTNINFPLYTTALDARDRSLQVTVSDDRADKLTIGHKKFGSTIVEILSEQNLSGLLQDKISQNLMDKGFKAGNDFDIKISLQSLQYQSNRGFFTGYSQGYGKIKVTVFNNIKNTQFSKNYEASNHNSYFIVSSAIEDQENINNLMQDLISGFLVDGDFLNHLETTDLNDSSMERLLKRWYMFN